MMWFSTFVSLNISYRIYWPQYEAYLCSWGPALKIESFIYPFLQELASKLHNEVYLQLGQTHQDRSSLCLQLMSGCCKGPAHDSLAAAFSFTAACPALLPAMNARILLSPMVDLAMHCLKPGFGGTDESGEMQALSIQTEIAEHATAPTASELGRLVEDLRASAAAVGIDPQLWPNASHIRLLAFCKELSRGPKAGLSDRYATVATMLQDMDAPDVSCAHALCFLLLSALSILLI